MLLVKLILLSMSRISKYNNINYGEKCISYQYDSIAFRFHSQNRRQQNHICNLINKKTLRIIYDLLLSSVCRYIVNNVKQIIVGNIFLYKFYDELAQKIL